SSYRRMDSFANFRMVRQLAICSFALGVHTHGFQLRAAENYQSPEAIQPGELQLTSRIQRTISEPSSPLEMSSPSPRKLLVDHADEVLQRLGACQHSAIDEEARGTCNPEAGSILYVLLDRGLIF